MKKSLLIIVGFIVCFASLKAQQVSLYNHYFYNPFIINPAYAGHHDNAGAMILNRSQWVGINSAPQINVFAIDGAIKEKKVGIGLTVFSNKRGINKITGGTFSYAYRANINDDIRFLFGLSAGATSYAIDYSKVITENASDPTLFSNNQQKTAFDGNAGFAFILKGLELDFTALQLAGTKVGVIDIYDTVRAHYTHARHFIAALKYKIPISKEKGMSIAPQGLVRIVPNAPLQYEANLNFAWKNKFWIGGTYKSNYAISANAGITVGKMLDVGYSYEIINNSLKNYAGLSHELVVNFRFGKGRRSNIDEDSSHVAKEEKHLATEQQMDSLKTVIEENEKKIAENRRKAEQNQERINELTNKIDELQKKQTELAASQNNNASNGGNTGGNNTDMTNSDNNNASSGTTNPTKNNNGNTNSSTKSGGAVNPNWTKTREGNVLIVSNASKDYVSSKKGSVKKGFYIVIGTFVYDDFASNEAKRLRTTGYPESDWMYSKSQQYNYVYVKRFSTKDEAIAYIKNVRASVAPDAWIKAVE